MNDLDQVFSRGRSNRRKEKRRRRKLETEFETKEAGTKIDTFSVSVH